MDDVLSKIILKDNEKDTKEKPSMKQPVEVKSVQFQTFGQNEGVGSNEGICNDILMDVPLQISVELGRVRKNISEILSFNKGTIIELNKLAGDTVDIVINNKTIGRGEVVVIDESYGVRITEILANKR